MADHSRQFVLANYIKEHWILFLLLLFGLIHGIVYVRLVPPWQHYDEPGHFEYAWLIAHQLKFPEEGDYNQSMRRELAASMIEFDFFKGMDFRPNLLSIEEPIWIGISQTAGLPLYYTLVALPLWVVQYTDITFQLYLARCVSLLLYLGTIVAAYGIAGEISVQNDPLRWLLPITVALLPGFVDVMTAVNDDVGATAVFSLFLWAGVRLIVKGFSWMRAIALVITAIACTQTKNTVIIAALLAGIPLVLNTFKRSPQRYVWMGMAVLVALLGLFVIRRGDAANWIRQTNQRIDTSAARVDAPVGKEVFQFNTKYGAFQLIPQKDIQDLRSKTITLGAWMWADNPTRAYLPGLRLDGAQQHQIAEIGRRPQYYTYTTTLPSDLAQMIVMVSPGYEPEHGGRVYYDGITLVEGDYSASGEPVARNTDASKLVWNSSIVKNYIRNASAESGWFFLSPRLTRLLDYYIPGRSDLYVSLLQDWRSANWYYRLTFLNLHQTFWGKFGWGHVPLQPVVLYPVLALISISGLVFAPVRLSRQRRELNLGAYLYLFISAAIIWFFTILRGLTSITEILFIPSARYAYPAIIPTILAFNLGWLEIIRWLRMDKNASRLAGIFLLTFLLLAVLAIYSIIHYYYLGAG
jgi:hypothetical protein